MKTMKCNCEGNGDAMKKENKEETKVAFDLSALTLEQLVEVYEDINVFIDYLNESKIELEEKGSEEDE